MTVLCLKDQQRLDRRLAVGPLLPGWQRPVHFVLEVSFTIPMELNLKLPFGPATSFP